MCVCVCLRERERDCYSPGSELFTYFISVNMPQVFESGSLSTPRFISRVQTSTLIVRQSKTQQTRGDNSAQQTRDTTTETGPL